MDHRMAIGASGEAHSLGGQVIIADPMLRMALLAQKWPAQL
jgi:hypothetical protein